jgi:hypothetical protein
LSGTEFTARARREALFDAVCAQSIVPQRKKNKMKKETKWDGVGWYGPCVVFGGPFLPALAPTRRRLRTRNDDDDDDDDDDESIFLMMIQGPLWCAWSCSFKRRPTLFRFHAPGHSRWKAHVGTKTKPTGSPLCFVEATTTTSRRLGLWCGDNLADQSSTT